MKVKFLKDRVTKNCPEDQKSYKAGQAYDLPNESAQHWINRGVAVEVVTEAPKLAPVIKAATKE